MTRSDKLTIAAILWIPLAVLSVAHRIVRFHAVVNDVIDFLKWLAETFADPLVWLAGLLALPILWVLRSESADIWRAVSNRLRPSMGTGEG
jgi:hypothetical protein